MGRSVNWLLVQFSILARGRNAAVKRVITCSFCQRTDASGMAIREVALCCRTGCGVAPRVTNRAEGIWWKFDSGVESKRARVVDSTALQSNKVHRREARLPAFCPPNFGSRARIG